MHHEEIDRGWSVVDTSGQKVGDVEEIGSNYLLVQKGLLFIKDLYIPTSEIRNVDPAAQTVYLDVAKDEIDDRGWDQPPAETGAGYDTGATSASGAYDTASAYDTTSSTSRGDIGDTDRQRVDLHEEELQAQTRREQAGEVQVSKRVVEEQRDLDVPVTHEQVEVRRNPVDRDVSGSEPAFADDGDTIRVPVTAEQVEVTKQPRVVEELEISKRPVTERQRVSDTVRREEADVQPQGDVVVGDTSSSEPVGAGADRFQRTNLDDAEGTDQGR
jgi:uncharacterized protein (TIGR02271 family)